MEDQSMADKVEWTEFNLTPKRPTAGGLKLYRGDEIHGFMFSSYRADEPRWIDGKHMELETIIGMAHQIELLLAALTGIAHCDRCATCRINAEETLAAYRSPTSGEGK